jgi:hypothetical protein
VFVAVDVHIDLQYILLSRYMLVCSEDFLLDAHHQEYIDRHSNMNLNGIKVGKDNIEDQIDSKDKYRSNR